MIVEWIVSTKKSDTHIQTTRIYANRVEFTNNNEIIFYRDDKPVLSVDNHQGTYLTALRRVEEGEIT